MNDPVPHCDDLPPRHFRMALSQLDRQSTDRLADHGQMMQYRGG
jgi:hypothetical protein